MKRFLLLIIFVPMMLSAATLSLRLTFDENDPCGYVTAPGRMQVPVFNVNVLLPAGADLDGYELQFIHTRPARQSFDQINPPWMNSEAVLGSDALVLNPTGYRFLGVKRWGDLAYASFQILPFDAENGSWYASAELSVFYTPSRNARNYIPATFQIPGFFINQRRLRQWYQKPSVRNYDFLVIGKPQHTNALRAWQSFRQSQGFIIQVEDIDLILASQQGVNNADKLRNYCHVKYQLSDKGV